MANYKSPSLASAAYSLGVKYELVKHLTDHFNPAVVNGQKNEDNLFVIAEKMAKELESHNPELVSKWKSVNSLMARSDRTYKKPIAQ
jgi:hypothetical protein